MLVATRDLPQDRGQDPPLGLGPGGRCDGVRQAVQPGQALQRARGLPTKGVGRRAQARIVGAVEGLAPVGLNGRTRVLQQLLLNRAIGGALEQLHQHGRLAARQARAVHRRRHLRLVAARQPHHLPRDAHRNQAHAHVLLHGLVEALDQGQPAAHPALVVIQQLADLRLRHALAAHQLAHHHRLLQIHQAAAAAVQPIHSRQRRALRERQRADPQLEKAQALGGGQALEPVHNGVGLPARARHDRGDLAKAPQRGRHRLLVAGLRQPEPAVAHVEGGQGYRDQVGVFGRHGKPVLRGCSDFSRDTPAGGRTF